jgi:hypothetical protein
MAHVGQKLALRGVRRVRLRCHLVGPLVRPQQSALG